MTTVLIDLSKYKKPLHCIVEDFLSDNFKDEFTFKETKSKKRVSFAENTKTHDGMEFAKQVTEFLIYAFFKTKSIQKRSQIKPALDKKFGLLDEKVTNRVIELLKDAYKRLYYWQPNINSTRGGIQLFRNTEGRYKFRFKKKNMKCLKTVVKLCNYALIQNKNKNKNKN